MRLKTLPKLFEEDGYKNRKHMMRCLEKNQSGVQCSRVFRFSYHDHPHIHRFPINDIQELNSPEADQLNYLAQPLGDKLMNEIASVFVNYNIPFSAIQSECFHNLIQALIPITDSEFKKMEQKKIFNTNYLTNSVIASSKQIEERFYECASRIGIVHFAIDEGTIHNRHFLDVLILTPYNEMKPFLGFTLEQSSFSSDAIGNFINDCILSVQSKNCKVFSIIADNLTVHTITFAHWKPPFNISILFPDRKCLLYSPCFCHTFQLILLTLSKINSSFQRFDQLLITISTFLRRPGMRNLIGSCPIFVKTRWLTRLETLLWILKCHFKIKKIEIDQLKKKDKRLFQQCITNENFQILGDFSRIISPFDVVTRFFEQDDSTISQVITVIQLFYKQLKRLQSNSNSEISNIIQDVIGIIVARIKKHYDCNLLKASFLLTMEGRFSIKFPQEPTPFKEIANFLFHPPIIEINAGPLYDSFLRDSNTASTNDGDIVQEDDENEIDEVDLDDTEMIDLDIFDEEDIDLLFKVEEPLQFLEAFLTEQCENHDISSDNVLPILEHFYFDPKIDERFGLRLQHFSPERNLIIWQWLGVNFPAWNEIINLIIGIISIPTSESAVERNFSRRKRIQTHLQSVTRSAVLLAKLRVHYQINNN
jgi:hypothetical protein